MSDDLGRFSGSPVAVAAATFEHRFERGQVTLELVGAWLKELENTELLRLYVAEDGDRYLELSNVYRPVKKGRAAVVRYPAPDSAQVPVESESTTPAQTCDGAPAGSVDARRSGPVPKKPRTNGKAELATAADAWEDKHGPMRSDLRAAMETYRCARAENRHRPWTARSWTHALATGNGNQVALIEAFEESAGQGWQSVDTKRNSKMSRAAANQDALARARREVEGRPTR
ncbi:MAG: hypothetical protein AAF726_20445 [Planctomycetota bacterium]